tara:strand:+ start:1125 stop:1862 length:738 start_codon:yes stop_codon:yes gene_type:complete
MKFKFILIFLILLSCSQNHNNINLAKNYSSKGFAYIYNELDYENNLIKSKLDKDLLQIAHNKLKPGTLIKITNIKSNDTIILKSSKRLQYPEFYKILITEPVANKLNLSNDLPLVEIIEVKKNKSFVAKKTKIFNEEKKIHSNAPVELVKIDNISKHNKKVIKNNEDSFYIIIAEFYSTNSASMLKKRIAKELTSFDSNKLYIKMKKSNKTSLLSGPYKSINSMKNDYIQLKNFGFEELDIVINE